MRDQIRWCGLYGFTHPCLVRLATLRVYYVHKKLTQGPSVYPSYNIHDDPEKPAILLCTYSVSSETRLCLAIQNTDHERISGHKTPPASALLLAATRLAGKKSSKA